MNPDLSVLLPSHRKSCFTLPKVRGVYISAYIHELVDFEVEALVDLEDIGSGDISETEGYSWSEEEKSYKAFDLCFPKDLGEDPCNAAAAHWAADSSKSETRPMCLCKLTISGGSLSRHKYEIQINPISTPVPSVAFGTKMSLSDTSKKRSRSIASNVYEDTLGLHSVSDESRRKIFNATAKALNMEEHQLDPNDWKKVAEDVLPNVFYPVELPGVKKDAPVIFYMCDVKPALNLAVQRCSDFQQRLQFTLNNIGNRKIDLILYNDEASGGNILAPNSAKKSSLWYFSLKQLGYLWADCMWFPLALIQHSQFDAIAGGFWAAVCRIIKEFLHQNLETGFPIQFASGVEMLRLEVRYMISDLDSIRYALDALGSSAIRCCIFCKNCLKKGTQLMEYNSYFVDIASHNLANFQEQTDGDVFQVVDAMVLQAPGLSKSALQKKETASGFHYNPLGLLFDRFAREVLPPSSFLLDTMHLYWSNGIVSWEVCELHERWKALGVGDLEAFLALDWQTSLQSSCTPSWRKRLGAEFNFQGSTYKGSASNLQAFLPLFEYFLSRVLPGQGLLVKELQCLQVLRKITIELRLLHCQEQVDNIEKLQELQVLHHRLLVETYTANFIKPKHHQRFHQCDQMKRVGFHVDAFAAERKHKAYKSHIGLSRFDPWTQDPRGMFSQLVLKAVYQHHLVALEQFNFGTKLLGRQSNSENIARSLGKTVCNSSNKILHEGKTFVNKDIILGEHPGVILEAAQSDSDFYVVIQPLHLEASGEFWSRWKKKGTKKLLPIRQAGQRPTWFLNLDDETILCLR